MGPVPIIFVVVLLAFAALIFGMATTHTFGPGSSGNAQLPSAAFLIALFVLSAVGLTLLYTRPSRDFYTGVAMWRAYRRGLRGRNDQTPDHSAE